MATERHPARRSMAKRRRIKEVPPEVLDSPTGRWLWHFAKGERTTFTVGTVAAYARMNPEDFADAVEWFRTEGWIREVQPDVWTGMI